MRSQAVLEVHPPEKAAELGHLSQSITAVNEEIGGMDLPWRHLVAAERLERGRSVARGQERDRQEACVSDGVGYAARSSFRCFCYLNLPWSGRRDSTRCELRRGYDRKTMCPPLQPGYP